jgi:hypothetical protein
MGFRAPAGLTLRPLNLPARRNTPTTGEVFLTTEYLAGPGGAIFYL